MNCIVVAIVPKQIIESLFRVRLHLLLAFFYLLLLFRLGQSQSRICGRLDLQYAIMTKIKIITIQINDFLIFNRQIESTKITRQLNRQTIGSSGNQSKKRP